MVIFKLSYFITSSYNLECLSCKFSKERQVVLPSSELNLKLSKHSFAKQWLHQEVLIKSAPVCFKEFPSFYLAQVDFIISGESWWYILCELHFMVRPMRTLFLTTFPTKKNLTHSSNEDKYFTLCSFFSTWAICNLNSHFRKLKQCSALFCHNIFFPPL